MDYTGADVDVDAEELAVPLGEDALEASGGGIRVVKRRALPSIHGAAARPAIELNVGARSTLDVVVGEDLLGHLEAGAESGRAGRPATVHDSMPGNHSARRAGFPAGAHPAAAGRAMRTWWRTDP